ncbi:hypothetical protein NPX13_g8773 [Xylaria arbuscula]|uniref:Uncharacterized protein n=1 Tax=Xylaria arbuscula TaxID=114810 RepID=A0A9W8TJU2_9PEZI|nr:hypothetical protein NPX13_g8773 [Xylaria arbuscula]
MAHRRKQSDPRTLASLEGRSASGTTATSNMSSSSGRVLARSAGENETKTGGKSSAVRRDDEELYREIDSIIDCYLRLSGAPEPVHNIRKAEAVASYFNVPEEVEMSAKGFI